MQHVSSYGGPRVLLPTADVDRWARELGDSPTPDGGLYGAACAVDAYCGVIAPWGVPLLILGDDPSAIYSIPGEEGAHLLIRWVAAHSLDQLLLFARAACAEGRWDEELLWHATTDAYTLMDTCDSHGDQGRIDLCLRPGTYRVRSKYATEQDVTAIVQELVPEPEEPAHGKPRRSGMGRHRVRDGVGAGGQRKGAKLAWLNDSATSDGASKFRGRAPRRNRTRPPTSSSLRGGLGSDRVGGGAGNVD